MIPLSTKLEQNLQAHQQILQLIQAKSQWSQFFQDLQTQLHKIGDAWLETLSIIETNDPDPSSLFQRNKNQDGANLAKNDTTTAQGNKEPHVTLKLTGYVIDRDNPLIYASPAIEQKASHLL